MKGQGRQRWGGYDWALRLGSGDWAVAVAASCLVDAGALVGLAPQQRRHQLAQLRAVLLGQGVVGAPQYLHSDGCRASPGHMQRSLSAAVAGRALQYIQHSTCLASFSLLPLAQCDAMAAGDGAQQLRPGTHT